MQEAWSAVETAWARIAATAGQGASSATPRPEGSACRWHLHLRRLKLRLAVVQAPLPSASSAYMAWLLPAEGAAPASTAASAAAHLIARSARRHVSRGCRPPAGSSGGTGCFGNVTWGAAASHVGGPPQPSGARAAPEARSARGQQRAPPPSALPTPPPPKPASAPPLVVSAPRQPPMQGVFPGDAESDDGWEDPAGFDLSSMSSALIAASGAPSNASAVPVNSSWASLAARGPDPAAGDSAPHHPRILHRPPSLASAASSGSAGGAVGAQQATAPAAPPPRKARQQPGAAAGGARQQPARSQQASRCAASTLCGPTLKRNNCWRKQPRMQILCSWIESIMRNGALLHPYWNTHQNLNHHVCISDEFLQKSQKRPGATKWLTVQTGNATSLPEGAQGSSWQRYQQRCNSAQGQ